MAIPKKKLEKDIQREICEELDKKGYLFWRSNNIPVFGKNNGGKMTFRAMPKYTPKGLPDIMLVFKGQFFALEVKRPGEKLRPDQAKYRDSLEKHGGIYYTIHDKAELPILGF
ncbi:MAG: VRR-NUC domain-containing protein [Bacteroidota bacterium]